MCLDIGQDKCLFAGKRLKLTQSAEQSARIHNRSRDYMDFHCLLDTLTLVLEILLHGT